MEINTEKNQKVFRYSHDLLDHLFELDLDIDEIYAILGNSFATFHFSLGRTIKDWEDLTMNMAEIFNRMGKP